MRDLPAGQHTVQTEPQAGNTSSCAAPGPAVGNSCATHLHYVSQREGCLQAAPVRDGPAAQPQLRRRLQQHAQLPARQLHAVQHSTQRGPLASLQCRVQQRLRAVLAQVQHNLQLVGARHVSHFHEIKQEGQGGGAGCAQGALQRGRRGAGDLVAQLGADLVVVPGGVGAVQWVLSVRQ